MARSLGEATDHFAQTEIDQMDIALGDAQSQSKPSAGKRTVGASDISNMTGLLSQIPGTGGLCQQAEYLKAQADAQAHVVASTRSAAEDPLAYGTSGTEPRFSAPPGSTGGPPGPGVPGMSATFDPIKTAAQIYVSGLKDTITVYMFRC